MYTDLCRISCVESGHIAECPVFGGLCGRNLGFGATMLEKFKEGLVRRTIIHLCQQLVDFGKEVAGAELAFANAPDVAIYFCGVQVVAAKQVPNFRWFAVDELGA